MAKQKESGTRRRLGRGLESLMSKPVKVETTPAAERAAGPAGTVTEPKPTAGRRSDEPHIEMVAADSVQANPRQPRRTFDPKALQQLAASIKAGGLMQPIVVRPGKKGGLELVAGERRLRACQLLGLTRVPAIVREIDDRTSAELSLVENLQREDLNPMERAEAFRCLVDEFKLTHEEIAKRVGLDRTSVTNHLRLDELDDYTKDAVRSGQLSMGHGRALLAITNNADREALARKAVRQGQSVRELERQIRVARGGGAKAGGATPTRRQAHLVDLERRLGEHLGTRVEIQQGRKKGVGKLVLSFYDLDQFEALVRRLGFKA